MKTIWLFCLSIFCLFSCKKDLGNYKYNEINEGTISGIDTAYVINQDQRFTVSPVINYSKDPHPDTSNYKYEWFQGIEVGFSGIAPTLISTKLKLDTLLNMDLGKYEMYFRVTDKRTGIYTLKNFRLSVINKGYEGWLVLSDIAGKSRVDMINTYGGQHKIYLNILDTMQSDLDLKGSPTAIGTSRSNRLNGGLYINYIVTNSGGFGLNYNTMKAEPLQDFTNTLPDKSFASYTDSRLYFAPLLDVIYTNGNTYIKANSASFGSFINQKDGGERFKAAPYYATAPSYYEPVTILFNEEAHQFYRYPGSGDLSFPLNIAGLSTKDQNLLYMTYSSYNGGEVFAVLRDPATIKTYLARFSLTGNLNYYGELTGTDILNAEQFTVNPEFGYLFYNAGNKVYEYDPALKKAILMLDLPAEKISMIKFYKFLMGNGADYPIIEKQLIVATYKEGNPDATGKLSLYEVPAINKSLILKNTFEGLGKIVDVTFKER